MIKNGNECACFEDVPYKSLLLVSDAEEENHCNVVCTGSNLYMCGGGNSVSIYVASKIV